MRPREESGRKALGKARMWCARGCRARPRPPCPGPHPHGARDWFSSRRCLRHRSFLRRTVAGRGGQRLLLRLPTHSPGLPERAPSPLLARHRLRPHGAFLNLYLLCRWNQPDSAASRREEPEGGGLREGDWGRVARSGTPPSFIHRPGSDQPPQDASCAQCQGRPTATNCTNRRSAQATSRKGPQASCPPTPHPARRQPLSPFPGLGERDQQDPAKQVPPLTDPGTRSPVWNFLRPFRAGSRGFWQQREDLGSDCSELAVK